MAPGESDIVTRVQAGEVGDFGQLYDWYIKKIYDFIYFKTFHRETAEDLTSQTFFKALEKINSFDQAKGTFSAWLYRIARNTVIDHYRTQKKEANIEDYWDISSDTDVAYEAEVNDQLEQIKKYLHLFKPQQREIILLRLWENLTFAEIADITGLSLANCKMTFSRTVRKIREELAPLLLWLMVVIKDLIA